jgi:catechol 2,3-dioxygenase-like lactoylglutathione lyase family enzyme
MGKHKQTETSKNHPASVAGEYSLVVNGATLSAMPGLLVNLDVPDIERAIDFSTRGLGLRAGRRFDDGFVELLGADAPLYLLLKSSGSSPFAAARVARDYERHWTPVHLDFVVDDLDAALSRAQSAGATLEGDISEHAYGRLALCADPFGHGFCLLEFRGRGYGELTTL